MTYLPAPSSALCPDRSGAKGTGSGEGVEEERRRTHTGSGEGHRGGVEKEPRRTRKRTRRDSREGHNGGSEEEGPEKETEEDTWDSQRIIGTEVEAVTSTNLHV